MGKTITSYLEEILIWHSQRGRRVVSSLQSGAQEHAFSAAEEALGFKLSESTHEFFSWRNGLARNEDAPIRELYLVPYYMPISLERSVKENRLGREAADWSPGWLPILYSGAGDFIVVNELHEAGCEVLSLEHAEEPLVVSASLFDFLRLSATCFSLGIYTEGSRPGEIQVDRARESQIRRSFRESNDSFAR